MTKIPCQPRMIRNSPNKSSTVFVIVIIISVVSGIALLGIGGVYLGEMFVGRPSSRSDYSRNSYDSTPTIRVTPDRVYESKMKDITSIPLFADYPGEYIENVQSLTGLQIQVQKTKRHDWVNSLVGKSVSDMLVIFSDATSDDSSIQLTFRSYKKLGIQYHVSVPRSGTKQGFDYWASIKIPKLFRLSGIVESADIRDGFGHFSSIDSDWKTDDKYPLQEDQTSFDFRIKIISTNIEDDK